ncbi:hypothetical protein Ancab_015246 [Ancistrocladus abbreviatus]
MKLQKPNFEINMNCQQFHVKLQLQKECRFGEQFFIVGNDPILGLWNPLGAIPMDWSDGHVWTTELDIPVGKSLQFKFILKKINGKILWQPGPDRILQMWQTKDTSVFWKIGTMQKFSK